MNHGALTPGRCCEVRKRVPSRAVRPFSAPVVFPGPRPTWHGDLFVPKQLMCELYLGPVCLSPALMVRRRSRLFAAVRRRCHAVRHSLVYLGQPPSNCGFRPGRGASDGPTGCQEVPTGTIGRSGLRYRTAVLRRCRAVLGVRLHAHRSADHCGASGEERSSSQHERCGPRGLASGCLSRLCLSRGVWAIHFILPGAALLSSAGRPHPSRLPRPGWGLLQATKLAVDVSVPAAFEKRSGSALSTPRNCTPRPPVVLSTDV